MNEKFSTFNWIFWNSLTDLLNTEYDEEIMHLKMKEVLEKHLLESSEQEANKKKKPQKIF